jgi:glycosyltransferase involved in cell wall biosynthesis
MTPRITIVTAGHLSTCPRMLKAADAVFNAGYRVRVVSARHTPWASQADLTVRATRRWDWTIVDYDRSTARRRQLLTGVRFHVARAAAQSIGPARVPLPVAIRAYSRAHDELVQAIASEPADFVYGGTTGGLAAAAEAGRQLGAPYALDLEDFHSAEAAGPDGDLSNALAARIERQILEGAAFLTAGSPMIAEAYAEKYGVHPRPIHNTFSLGRQVPVAREPAQPLRLYWFSQTLGPDRGLEVVIEAAGRAGVEVDLHLRARAIPAYLRTLRHLQRDLAPSLTLVHLEPAAPDDMVAVAQAFDAGLSCENPTSLNHQICLGNKIFTYLAAGIPVVMSATPAQARLARDLDRAALIYTPGDVDALAGHIQRLAKDGDLRRCSRLAARAAAERRWHWEHADDRGALLDAVDTVVARS